GPEREAGARRRECRPRTAPRRGARASVPRRGDARGRRRPRRPGARAAAGWPVRSCWSGGWAPDTRAEPGRPASPGGGAPTRLRDPCTSYRIRRRKMNPRNPRLRALAVLLLATFAAAACDSDDVAPTDPVPDALAGKWVATPECRPTCDFSVTLTSNPG